MQIQLKSVKKLFDYKLLLLFLSLCLIIILKSFLDPDGFLTFDSTYYLRLSKNLLLNEGFRIPDYLSPDGKTFFAIWPVGYPVMIFLTAKLTGLGVAWASKALSLIMIGATLLLFKLIFRETAHWAGLIFFIDANILIFSYTWSEGPFIFFLLTTSFALYKSVATEGKFLWLAGLFLSGTALFLVRYIGLISAGIIGLAAVIFLFRRKWILSISLLAVSLSQMIIAGLYLYHNKISTGYFTGGSRDLPEESGLEMLNQFFSALKEEFIFVKSGMPLIVSLLLFSLLGLYLFRNRKERHRDDRLQGLWKYFLLTGAFYLAAIVVIRWFFNFESLNFRFLAPGTFLIVLALATYLKGKPGIKIMNSTVVYLLILLTLTINYTPSTIAILKYITTGKDHFRHPVYVENTRGILEKYKDVEPNSIVIFGSEHLLYLRENIIPSDLYEKHPLDDYVKHFTQKNNWNVYINITEDLDPEIIHDDFIQFMQTNKDKPLIKVH